VKRRVQNYLIKTLKVNKYAYWDVMSRDSSVGKVNGYRLGVVIASRSSRI